MAFSIAHCDPEMICLCFSMQGEDIIEHTNGKYTLDLNGCENLKALPKTLGNLISLITLDLSGCLSLKELLETLDNLTSLVTLDFSGCFNLKESLRH